ncbi:246_t:CDS:2, partial [Racocetra fulgida]
LPHVANHYFPAIDLLIQKYLTPHVLSLQQQQLSESFLYDASEITYNQISVDKDFVALLLPIKLYELNESSTYDTIPQTVDFWYLSHFHIANVFTPSLQKSVSEKARWSKGHGIAKKALDLTICHNCNDKFFGMMEEFISSKMYKLQHSKENRNASNIELQPAITNPLVTKHRGHPPK